MVLKWWRLTWCRGSSCPLCGRVPVCLQKLFSHGASMPVGSLGLLASRYVPFNEVVQFNFSIQLPSLNCLGSAQNSLVPVVVANRCVFTAVNLLGVCQRNTHLCLPNPRYLAQTSCLERISRPALTCGVTTRPAQKN